MSTKSYNPWQWMTAGGIVLCVTVLAILIWPPRENVETTPPNDDLSQRAAASRAVVKELATRLKKKLVSAMKTAGPASAVQVCNAVAPTITQDVTENFDGQIGRTALKLRNLKNAPDAWEQKILEKFTTEIKSGVEPKTLEHFEVRNKNGKPVFRYMKAIATQQPCLACHGPNVDPTLRQIITSLYPSDEAIGFTPGSLRGAFTVTQPMN